MLDTAPPAERKREESSHSRYGGCVSVVDEILAALEDRGWSAANIQPVFGRSPNPTRVDLVHAGRGLPLVLYAWKVTGEGRGRRGNNYRIQTTRAHEGELLNDPHRLTLGLGLDQERDVVVAFDGWTKRNTGSSSSVHIKRSLLDAAATTGFSTDGMDWDSRVACRRSEIEKLLPWVAAQRNRRVAPVVALSQSISGDTAVATADLWDSAPAAWLRPGDHLVLVDQAGTRLVDDSIWTVREIGVEVTTLGRNPRRTINFNLTRHGRAQDPNRVLDALWAGRSPNEPAAGPN